MTDTVIVLGVINEACAAYIKNSLQEIDGIVRLTIRIPEKIAVITYDPEKTSKMEIEGLLLDSNRLGKSTGGNKDSIIHPNIDQEMQRTAK